MSLKTIRKYKAYIVLKCNEDKKINMMSSYWESKLEILEKKWCRWENNKNIEKLKRNLYTMWLDIWNGVIMIKR